MELLLSYDTALVRDKLLLPAAQRKWLLETETTPDKDAVSMVETSTRMFRRKEDSNASKSILLEENWNQT